MEIETKESRKLRIDKSLELCEWLMRNHLTLYESAIVLGCIEEGRSLAEALMIVFLNKKESHEKGGSSIFNDPIAF